MIRMMKALGGLLLATALVACGGGGGSSGTTTGGGTGGGTGNGGNNGGTATAASMIYQLSKQSINTSGSDGAVLTVTALDANNNPVADVAVTVSPNTGVFTPTTAGGRTDANGTYVGTISAGGNKADRTITAQIQVGTLSASAAIVVSGSQLTVTPVPATPAPGQSVRVDARVTDSNGSGIAFVPVTFSGTLGLNQTVTSDALGNVSVTLGAAPATAGTYTVEVAAQGVQATRSVQVVVPGGATGISDAVGPVSSASLAIVPNTIAPNTAGSTTNRAVLRAKFLNGSNQAIQNVRVKFQIDPPQLGSGEAISNTGVVYSDVNGEAIADYIAGTRSSPTNGVVIRACYSLTDAAVPATCNSSTPNSVTQTLTVAAQPLSVTLGDNNLLEKGNNELTYIKRFDIAVADSAGNAVANANISASVDITHYGKGGFSYQNTAVAGSPTYQVTGNNPPNITTTGISTTATPSPTTGRVWCPNEDTNRNGFLDAGEDINGNGTLEPRKADVILSFLGSNVTGANGRLQVQVEYPQNVATWLAYTVRVTTNVAGSEGTVAKSYITNFVIGDEDNGAFLTPPYGASRCNAPN